MNDKALVPVEQKTVVFYGDELVAIRAEYGGVYGELYRKFSITSYKLLPAKKFEEAMNWLTEWHQSMVGDEPFCGKLLTSALKFL
jgi:hypothetical protein